MLARGLAYTPLTPAHQHMLPARSCTSQAMLGRLERRKKSSQQVQDPVARVEAIEDPHERTVAVRDAAKDAKTPKLFRVRRRTLNGKEAEDLPEGAVGEKSRARRQSMEQEAANEELSLAGLYETLAPPSADYCRTAVGIWRRELSKESNLGMRERAALQAGRAAELFTLRELVQKAHPLTLSGQHQSTQTENKRPDVGERILGSEHRSDGKHNGALRQGERPLVTAEAAGVAVCSELAAVRLHLGNAVREQLGGLLARHRGTEASLIASEVGLGRATASEAASECPGRSPTALRMHPKSALTQLNPSAYTSIPHPIGQHPIAAASSWASCQPRPSPRTPYFPPLGSPPLPAGKRHADDERRSLTNPGSDCDPAPLDVAIRSLLSTAVREQLQPFFEGDSPVTLPAVLNGLPVLPSLSQPAPSPHTCNSRKEAAPPVAPLSARGADEGAFVPAKATSLAATPRGGVHRAQQGQGSAVELQSARLALLNSQLCGLVPQFAVQRSDPRPAARTARRAHSPSEPPSKRSPKVHLRKAPRFVHLPPANNVCDRSTPQQQAGCCVEAAQSCRSEIILSILGRDEDHSDRSGAL